LKSYFPAMEWCLRQRPCTDRRQLPEIHNSGHPVGHRNLLLQSPRATISAPVKKFRTKHMNQRVSIVVPSYNHATYIERCLRSILKQSLHPSELLVIDDGSTDGSPGIIERVLADCPFPCQFIARENHGLCATLNFGFARASGVYFAYLGSDDVWLPGFLAARVKLLESRPNAVLAYGHVYIIDGLDRVVECTRDWARYEEGEERRWLWSTQGLYSPSICFRRATLPPEPWNENFKLEDYELYLRLSLRGEFALDDNVLAAWRQHGENTSRKLDWMMEECLSAQARVAAEAGIDDAELARIQRTVQWQYAEIFARHGEKRKAYALVKGNWRGAPSIHSATKMLGRLLIPHGVVQSLRRKRTAPLLQELQPDLETLAP
jgi:alpha-1,3-rhamnosyltransferase